MMASKQPLQPEVKITHPFLSIALNHFPNLPVPMTSPHATWHKGRLYIGGGGAKKALTLKERAQLYIYAPEESTWFIIETPTYMFGLTTFDSNLVIAGGKNFPSTKDTSAVFVYRGNGQWQSNHIEPMKTKRNSLTAVGVGDLLMVAGGFSDNKTLTSVELFNNCTKVWKTITALPLPCNWMAATIHNGHVYLFRGRGPGKRVFHCALDSLESSPQWETLNVPVEHSSLISYQGILLSIGGKADGSLSSSIFALNRGEWLLIGDHPLCFSHTCTTQLPNGKIITVGGFTGSEATSQVFELDIQGEEAALKISNIILSAVQNSLYAPLERVLEEVKTCSPQTDISLLLDFLAHVQMQSDIPPSTASSDSVERSWSPLMVACDKQDLKMVDVLLKNGASIDYKNINDVTAVHIACGSGNMEVLQQLVKTYSDKSNNPDEVTKLLQMIDKKDQNVLHYACYAPNGGETLKWLLILKDLAMHKMLNSPNKSNYTPLLTACDQNNLTAAHILLSLPEVDATARNNDKQTGLHLTAMNDSAEMAELLLKKGCPSNSQDSEGNTALHVAYKQSSYSIVTVLEKLDGVRIKNKTGQYPSDIEPENIIPSEILKRGLDAVQVYRDALKNGKKKIPLCNLIILGEKRVGKTSVLRLLVLDGFDPNQDSTRGIDNLLIDTHQIGAEDWQKKDKSTIDQQTDLQLKFARGVSGLMLSSDIFAQNGTQILDSTASIVTDSELLEEILELMPTIRQIFSLKQNSKSGPGIQLELPHVQPIVLEDRDTPKSMVTHEEHSEAQAEDLHSDQIHLPTAENDLKPPPIENTKPTETAPKLNKKQALLIDKQLKVVQNPKETEELTYNVLDFAGQKYYKSMHHCFITYRTIYLVVFNLQHMIPYLEKKASSDDAVVPTDPFEEIRYWIHSVHTHCPPVKGEKVMKNILLVGTHQAPPHELGQGREIKKEELKKINDLIKEKIYSDDDRCANHLHFIKKKDEKTLNHEEDILVPVESSICGNKPKDRIDSGAKALQREIELISSKLQFLNKDHPIIWLQFESELVKVKEKFKAEKSSLVVKTEDILKVASQCGLVKPVEQDLALKFFHDTGKIVYLKLLPCLFISEEERTELSGLLLLDPTWLFDIMKNVVELDICSNVIEGNLIRQLRETGIAPKELLFECWSEYLQEPINESFHQMCLMMQAECLIHPIKLTPDQAVETFSAKGSSQQPTSQATSDTVTLNDENFNYLVPCKLPKKESEDYREWITFYFDFQKFLPEVIYHRLICLMMAVSQSSPSFDKPHLSKNVCHFSRIDRCRWKIELEVKFQRLKISVLSSDADPRSPTHHIKTIHTQYLQRICTFSNLKGLRYVGGPLLDPCENFKCKKRNVIRYVSYFEGNDLGSESICPDCLKQYDVHKLLTDQMYESPVQPKKSDHDTDVALQKDSIHQWAPSLKEAFKVTLPLSSKWQSIGTLLEPELPEGTLDKIRADYFNQSDACHREMLKCWLRQANPHPTWKALAEAIEPFDASKADLIRKKYHCT